MENQKTIIRSLKDMNGYISTQLTQRIEKRETRFNSLTLTVNNLNTKSMNLIGILKDLRIALMKKKEKLETLTIKYKTLSQEYLELKHPLQILKQNLNQKEDEYNQKLQDSKWKSVASYKGNPTDIRKKIYSSDFFEFTHNNQTFLLEPSLLTCWSELVDGYEFLEFDYNKKRCFLIITDNYPITNEMRTYHLQDVEQHNGFKRIPTTFIIYLESNGAYKTDVMGNLFYNLA